MKEQKLGCSISLKQSTVVIVINICKGSVAMLSTLRTERVKNITVNIQGTLWISCKKGYQYSPKNISGGSCLPALALQYLPQIGLSRRNHFKVAENVQLVQRLERSTQHILLSGNQAPESPKCYYSIIVGKELEISLTKEMKIHKFAQAKVVRIKTMRKIVFMQKLQS